MTFQKHFTTLSLTFLLGAVLTHGQARPDADLRVNAGLQAAGSSVASGATRYHLLLSGDSLPDEQTLAEAMEKIEQARPSNPDQVRAALRSSKIEALTLKQKLISVNVTVPKQTQGATFGERVNAGQQRGAAGAGGGAASAAYAATGRAPREMVIVFCDNAQQEQEAARLISSHLEAVPSEEKAARTIQDERRGMTSIIRRVSAPGGRQWTWVSGALKP